MWAGVNLHPRLATGRAAGWQSRSLSPPGQLAVLQALVQMAGPGGAVQLAACVASLLPPQPAFLRPCDPGGLLPTAG